MTEQRKQELRAQCASASDDGLRGIIKHSASYSPDVVAIAEEILISRESGLSHEMKLNPETDFGTGPLTALCAQWYCLIFELGLWLLLIGGIIGGFKLGREVGALLIGTDAGALIGAAIGILIAILVTLSAGGIISVFLNLCADVGEIRRKLKN